MTADYEQLADGYHLTIEGSGRRQNYDLEMVDVGAYLTGEDNWAAALDGFGSASGVWTEVQDASGKTWAGADILTSPRLSRPGSARRGHPEEGHRAGQPRLPAEPAGKHHHQPHHPGREPSGFRIPYFGCRCGSGDDGIHQEQHHAQAATSMLAQANSLAQLALSLLG